MAAGAAQGVRGVTCATFPPTRRGVRGAAAIRSRRQERASRKLCILRCCMLPRAARLGVEMKAYVAGESPKTMTVETSDGKKGPWRPVASLSADAAWGEDVPWARVSEPDPAVKHWSWAPKKLGRYLRLTFTSSFNGDAPTMYHTFFYPPVPTAVHPEIEVHGGGSSSGGKVEGGGEEPTVEGVVVEMEPER